MYKIYLAGGMHSDWRCVFYDHPDIEVFDPATHGLTNPKDYTEWDLRHIREADAVIAYMDSANPSGYGLSLEIGYAHALGKPVIFFDELGGDWRSKYFDMHRSVSVVVATAHDAMREALEAIKRGRK